MPEKNINEAIVAIMGKVGYVQKERSPNLNYSFAGEAALIRALRPVMIEHGVFAHVVAISSGRETYTTAKGSVMNVTALTGTVRFLHAPSGTHIDVQAVGEGADIGDKSSNKAATGMLKYALRQTFLIETGDDPDSESSDEQARAVEQRAPKKTVREALMDRWNERISEARHYGIEVEPLAANLTDDEIRERGRELKAAIDAAKEKK